MAGGQMGTVFFICSTPTGQPRDLSQVPSLPEVLASLTIKWGQCDWPPRAAVLESECSENQVLSELSVGPAQQIRAAFLLHVTTVTVLIVIIVLFL